jgi:hypothetical protein
VEDEKILYALRACRVRSGTESPYCKLPCPKTKFTYAADPKGSSVYSLCGVSKAVRWNKMSGNYYKNSAPREITVRSTHK